MSKRQRLRQPTEAVRILEPPFRARPNCPLQLLERGFHLLKVNEYVVFPLLVFKGIYHYWTYLLIFSRGLKQMEAVVEWIPLLLFFFFRVSLCYFRWVHTKRWRRQQKAGRRSGQKRPPYLGCWARTSPWTCECATLG